MQKFDKDAFYDLIAGMITAQSGIAKVPGNAIKRYWAVLKDEAMATIESTVDALQATQTGQITPAHIRRKIDGTDYETALACWTEYMVAVGAGTCQKAVCDNKRAQRAYYTIGGSRAMNNATPPKAEFIVAFQADKPST